MSFFCNNRRKMDLLARVVVFIGVIVSPHTLADPQVSFENPQNIVKTARLFLEEMTNAADNPAMEISVNRIDTRLRLRLCKSEIWAKFPNGSRQKGKVTIAVGCDSPVKWKVLVSASVYEYADILVVNRDISRKTALSKQDISLKRVNISTLRKTPLFEKSRAIGSMVKRHLRAGSIIFENSICLVCRGDNVHISANSEFFKIDLEGVALADAGLGELTQVRNNHSKRTFNAKVVGKNRLEVSLSATK